MDLSFTGDQEQLTDLTSKYASAELPLSRWHKEGAPEEEGRWLLKAAELGWLGMNPSMDGEASGFSLIDEILVFRQLGRQLAGLSMYAAAIAAKLASISNDPDLSDELASGQHVVAVGIRDHRSGDGACRLFSNGRPDFALLMSGETFLLHTVDQQALPSSPCLEPTHNMYQPVDFGGDARAQFQSPELHREARLILAAMNVGQAEACCEMITEYAKVRHTFGRPIGAYQAVRHPIAEMAARAKQAENLTYFAALASSENHDNAQDLCTSSLRLSQQAATKNADVNIQLHGAIGVTDELDAHLFMKRAILTGLIFRDGENARV